MRLDEYTKDEWFSIARVMKPGLTRDEYEAMWDRFIEAKREHERSSRLN